MHPNRRRIAAAARSQHTSLLVHLPPTHTHTHMDVFAHTHTHTHTVQPRSQTELKAGDGNDNSALPIKQAQEGAQE
jgi:hypothetical protein